MLARPPVTVNMLYRGKLHPASYIDAPLGTRCHVVQTRCFQAPLGEQGRVVEGGCVVYHRETRAQHGSLQYEVQRLESLPRETYKNNSKTPFHTSEDIGVHDGTGTVISIEKGESDGLVIGQLKFSRGVQGKCFLGHSSLKSFMSECTDDVPANPCFQYSQTVHPSALALPSNDKTFSKAVPPPEDRHPSTPAHYTPRA